MDTRRGKEDYYLDIADAVLNRSTCLRRKYGAIIVRNDEILSTGYNGAPRGRRNCTDVGGCMRETLGIPSGERYELCRSVHAEVNAIICLIINAGITQVVVRTGTESNRVIHVRDWVFNDDSLPANI